MARELEKDMASIAMGSLEGYSVAERMVQSASKRGSWVLLKNCHLCTEWLQDSLIKKLQTIGSVPHPDFRLFITSEISPKLPTALLRFSDIIVAEAPSGIKASLTRFISSISSERFDDPLRNRLYLLLGWAHAVIQERLRYVPSGWTEVYEFTEADAQHALDVIDTLLEGASRDPEKLPWDAIRTTLCKSIFGGRITKDIDQKSLDDLVSSLFVPSCFDVGFKLVDEELSPRLPDSTTKNSCFEWIESLDDHTSPTWIGLDASAETARSESIARSVMMKTTKVQEILNSYDN